MQTIWKLPGEVDIVPPAKLGGDKRDKPRDVAWNFWARHLREVGLRLEDLEGRGSTVFRGLPSLAVGLACSRGLSGLPGEVNCMR